MSADGIVYVCVVPSQFSGPTRTRMKLLLSLAVLGVTLGVLYSAPDGQAPGVTDDTLKREATQKNTDLSVVFSVEYLQVKDHCRRLPVQRLFSSSSLPFEDFSSCCFGFFMFFKHNSILFQY